MSNAQSAGGVFAPLVRMKYFHGQLLTHEDLALDQQYHRARMGLHTRCLHGWGVVCGLEVRPLASPPACPPPPGPDPRQHDPAQRHPRDDLRLAEEPSQRAPVDEGLRTHEVVVHPGLAIDCEGNELVLRRACSLDLRALLSDADRARLRDGPQTIFLSVCFAARGIEPCRPLGQDECPGPGGVVDARIREGIRFRASLEDPMQDRRAPERCEPCCDECTDCCVALARVDGVTLEGLEPAAVDNGIRRPLSRYLPTVITGTSWAHGASYRREVAEELMSRIGLRVEFSRPIRTSTLREGVVDVWLITGGRGRAGNIEHIAGELLDLDPDGAQRALTWRQTSREAFNDGDRLLVTVRTSFILDRCCRPVDGTHAGGQVPILPAFADRFGDPDRPDHGCPRPPGGFAPWTSGTGTPGGDFVSWFFVRLPK